MENILVPERSAEQIVEFLLSTGLTELDPPQTALLDTIIISGIAEDSKASPGDLSWISANAIKEDPTRVDRFRGALLITPVGLDSQHSASACIVPCERPRLAFAEVVTGLFAELLNDMWPISVGVISPDARIGSRVRLSAGVVIGPHVAIGNDVTVGPNSTIVNTTIASNVSIGANCSIGLRGFGYEKRPDGTLIRFPQLGRVSIESDVEIGSNVCIDRGALGVTQVCSGSKIDNLVHIAHNVYIGRNTLVIANTMIGGSTHIGDGVWLAPSAALMNKISVGDNAVVGLGAVVTRNVEEGATVVGNPARRLEKKGELH
jgi:UDP-3-O-[3-hydroxymyristoyl] glucosamine N-acyltransferase